MGAFFSVVNSGCQPCCLAFGGMLALRKGDRFSNGTKSSSAAKFGEVPLYIQ